MPAQTPKLGIWMPGRMIPASTRKHLDHRAGCRGTYAWSNVRLKLVSYLTMLELAGGRCDVMMIETIFDFKAKGCDGMVDEYFAQPHLPR